MQFRFQLLTLLAVPAALLMLTGSCTKEVAKPVTDPDPDACDTTISYTTQIGPLVNQKCVSCHGANNPPAGINLTTYEALKTIADNGKLENVIFKGIPRFMPDGTVSGLPENEKKLIRCWLDNGKKK
jgi:uncharacterized membrane protein